LRWRGRLALAMEAARSLVRLLSAIGKLGGKKWHARICAERHKQDKSLGPAAYTQKTRLSFSNPWTLIGLDDSSPRGGQDPEGSINRDRQSATDRTHMASTPSILSSGACGDQGEPSARLREFHLHCWMCSKTKHESPSKGRVLTARPVCAAFRQSVHLQGTVPPRGTIRASFMTKSRYSIMRCRGLGRWTRDSSEIRIDVRNGASSIIPRTAPRSRSAKRLTS
jgi:hypothetical protein